VESPLNETATLPNYPVVPGQHVIVDGDIQAEIVEMIAVRPYEGVLMGRPREPAHFVNVFEEGIRNRFACKVVYRVPIVTVRRRETEWLPAYLIGLDLRSEHARSAEFIGTQLSVLLGADSISAVFHPSVLSGIPWRRVAVDYNP
jgi:hypothetical protein